MKKMFLLIIIILLLSSCSTSNEATNETVDASFQEVSVSNESTKAIGNEDDTNISLEVIYGDDFWGIYDFSTGPYNSRDEFEVSLYTYIEEVESTLNKEGWKDQYALSGIEHIFVKLIIKPNLGKHATISEPEVYGVNAVVFNLYVLPEVMTGEIKRNPICHEMVHMVSYDVIQERWAYNPELNEGLAEYVAYEIGGDLFDCTYGFDDHIAATLYASYLVENGIVNSEEVKSIASKLCENSIEPQFPLDTEEWNLSFSLAISFCKFIVDNYSLDDYVYLQDTTSKPEEMSIKEGRLKDMNQEWMEYFYNIETDYTMDDMNAYMLKYK